MDDADERLEIEAAQQDPSNFGGLYERHFGRVYAFVVSRVRDRSAAEDVTAEVFQKALAALPDFRFRGAPFAAWLFRIAANTMADRARRAGREVSVTYDGPSPLLRGAPEPSVQPDGDAFDREAHLFRLVDALPADQRRVLIERFIEERSIKEIASRLNRTEGAVKQLQFRALQTLRGQIEGGHA